MLGGGLNRNFGIWHLSRHGVRHLSRAPPPPVNAQVSSLLWVPKLSAGYPFIRHGSRYRADICDKMSWNTSFGIYNPIYHFLRKNLWGIIFWKKKAKSCLFVHFYVFCDFRCNLQELFRHSTKLTKETITLLLLIIGRSVRAHLKAKRLKFYIPKKNPKKSIMAAVKSLMAAKNTQKTLK